MDREKGEEPEIRMKMGRDEEEIGRWKRKREKASQKMRTFPSSPVSLSFSLVQLRKKKVGADALSLRQARRSEESKEKEGGGGG